MQSRSAAHFTAAAAASARRASAGWASARPSASALMREHASIANDASRTAKDAVAVLLVAANSVSPRAAKAEERDVAGVHQHVGDAVAVRIVPARSPGWSVAAVEHGGVGRSRQANARVVNPGSLRRGAALLATPHVTCRRARRGRLRFPVEGEHGGALGR